MPGAYGRSPRRRTGVAVLVAAGALVLGMIQLLGLLIPTPTPVLDVDPDAPTATCEEPELDRVPVPVRSGTLFTCPEAFDGRLVAVEGEVVGDLLDGPGDRGWVLLNDDAYSRVGPLPAHGQNLGTNSGVPVLLPDRRRPAVLGGPSTRGDVIAVLGTFRRAADEDQGGPAVIAESVVTRQQGGRIDEVAATRLRVATPIAVAVAAALGAAIAVRRRRELA